MKPSSDLCMVTEAPYRKSNDTDVPTVCKLGQPYLHDLTHSHGDHLPRQYSVTVISIIAI